jgi:hypothetical protein
MKYRLSRAVKATLAATLLTGLAPAADSADLPALPQLGDLDHFLCYPVNVGTQRYTPEIQQVEVRDQFLPLYLPVRVGEPDMLCNPVTKTVKGAPPTPRKRPGLHLFCYAITHQASAQYGFKYDNQFQEAATAIADPMKQLCLPSHKQKRKNDEEFPALPPNLPGLAGLSHFTCYPVRSDTTFNKLNIKLEDQFKEYTVNVTGPVRLCNPAKKRVTFRPPDPGQPNPPRRRYDWVTPALHLVCYKISSEAAAPGVRARVHSQFDGKPRAPGTWRTATPAAPAELCLPSYKQKT